MGCFQGKPGRSGQQTEKGKYGFDKIQEENKKPQRVGPFGLFKRQTRPGKKVSKKFFAILSVHSQKVMDVPEGKRDVDAIIWSDNGNDNQQFTISPNNLGQYRVRNRQTKQYLTVSGPQKGAKLVFRDGQNNNVNQLFHLDQVGQKTYLFKTYYKMVIDVQQCSKKKGAHIIQWQYNGGQNQKWRMMDPKDITSSSSDWEGGW